MTTEKPGTGKPSTFEAMQAYLTGAKDELTGTPPGPDIPGQDGKPDLDPPLTKDEVLELNRLSGKVRDSFGPTAEENARNSFNEKLKEMQKARDFEAELGGMSDETLKAITGENAGFGTKKEYDAALAGAKASGLSEREFLEGRYQKRKKEGKATEEVLNNQTEFTDEERKAFKLQNQCFLITYMDKFIGHARSVRAGGYGYMTCVDGSDPSLLVSKTTSRVGVSSLMSARAKDFAQLIPKIRLYKVEKGIEQQIKFSTFSASPDSMTEDRGSRGDDVGLVSVSFDFMNQNVALAQRLSDVTIKLIFKNGNDLVKRNSAGFSYLDLFQRGSGDGSHYEDYELKLVVGYEIPANVKEGTFSTKNFLKEVANLDTVMHLNLKNYDLNFRENGVLELTLNYASFIEENLNSGRYNIFGNAKQFEETALHGADTESLTDEEIATDRSAERNKIRQDAKEKRRAKKQEFKDAEVGWEGDLEGWKEARAEINAERDRKLAEIGGEKAYAKKKRQGRRDYISKLKTKSKMKMYKAILNTLTLKSFFMDIPMQLMVQVEQDLDSIKFAKFLGHSSYVPGLINDKEIVAMTDARKEYASIGFVEGASGDEKRQMETKGESQATTHNVYKDINMTGDKFESVDQVVSGLQEMQGMKDSWADLPINNEGGNNYRLHFFYLGDLIESVITARDTDTHKAGLMSALAGLGLSAGTASPPPPGPPINDLEDRMRDDKLRLMMGPMTYNHVFPDGSKKPIVTCLADIPISLDYFQEWFAEEIVSKELTFMNFHTFLQKVIGGLLVNALGPHCFGEDSDIAQFSQLMLSVPPKSDGSSHIPGVGKFTRPEGSWLTTNVARAVAYSKPRRVHMDSIPISPAPNESTRVSDFSNYLYVYITSQKSWSKMGNRDQDEKDGIYHFSVGQESGLLKGIKFEKQKIKGVSEALAAQSVEEGSGTGQGMMIWQPYNANMSLIGNPLLKPGQMVYIDTTSAGMGDPRAANSTSRKLGLGGYYFILKSRNEISSKGWQTDVSGLFQTAGYPHNAEGGAHMLSYAKTATPAANVSMDPSLEYQLAHLVDGGKDGDGDPGSISEAPEDIQTGKGSSGTQSPSYKGPKKKLPTADETALQKVKTEQEIKDLFNQAGIPYETSEEALEKKMKDMGFDWDTEGEKQALMKQAEKELAEYAAEFAKLQMQVAQKQIEQQAAEAAEAEKNKLLGAIGECLAQKEEQTQEALDQCVQEASEAANAPATGASQEQESDVLEAQKENIKKQEIKENQEKAKEAATKKSAG